MVYFGTVLFYLQGTFRQYCYMNWPFCLILVSWPPWWSFEDNFQLSGFFFWIRLLLSIKNGSKPIVNLKNHANQFYVLFSKIMLNFSEYQSNNCFFRPCFWAEIYSQFSLFFLDPSFWTLFLTRFLDHLYHASLNSVKELSRIWIR